MAMFGAPGVGQRPAGIGGGGLPFQRRRRPFGLSAALSRFRPQAANAAYGQPQMERLRSAIPGLPREENRNLAASSPYMTLRSADPTSEIGAGGLEAAAPLQIPRPQRLRPAPQQVAAASAQGGGLSDMLAQASPQQAPQQASDPWTDPNANFGPGYVFSGGRWIYVGTAQQPGEGGPGGSDAGGDAGGGAGGGGGGYA